MDKFNHRFVILFYLKCPLTFPPICFPLLDMPTSFTEGNLRSAIKMQTNDLQNLTNVKGTSKSLHGSLSKSSLDDMPIFMIYMEPPKLNVKKEEIGDKIDKSLWNCPMKSRLNTLWWIYTWPIKFILTLTIPNPKTYRRMYPLTFILCIIWIGLNSYLVVWMLSAIGNELYSD